ncbi:hypothetical protein [Gilvimarinus chinensis]|uniref:hypothetical protein n=1 Tax=Gilvimarinus chinensis TaxID=396005 RepID=UPI00038103FF|nr:hypothetical protein [Gilvimarinus chinensis]
MLKLSSAVQAGVIYVLAAVVVALASVGVYQHIEIGQLETRLDAEKSKALVASINAASAQAQIESLTVAIESHEDTIAALEEKRDQLRKDAEIREARHLEAIEAIRKDVAETPEQVRQKLIRHAKDRNS